MADGTIKILTDLDASGFQKGISKLGSIASTGLKATTAAIAAAGGAIAGLLGASVKTGMDFEQQMSRVNAISGATAEEFAALEKQAIDLGASTAFSATEAAEGMENLASAGFSTTEIMAAMPGMLDLAASSGADLAQSADIAASTLRGFGLEAADAGHVADVLAKTAADTNAAVEDTGEAMKYVAPVAHAFGISMEETAAAIGIMSDAGIKGSQAGTTLRGALSRLAKPTDVMQDTMDALGISFFNAEGKMLSLTEMTAMLKDKTAGLTDEQRNAALVTLFGQESLSGMLALMEAGPEKISSLTASLENCDGAAAEMAETMMDNLAGAVEEFSGAAETLGILVYQSIEEPLKEVVQTATGYIGDLQAAFESDGLNGAVAALGTIFSDVAAQAANAAPKMIDAGKQMISSFLTGITKNAKRLATSAANIGKSFVSALLKIVPEVGKAGLKLITEFAKQIAGYRIGKDIESLGATMLKSFSKIASSVGSALESITPLLQNLSGIAIRVAETGIRALSNAIAFLCDNIEIILPLASAAAAAFAAFSIAQSVTTAIQGMISAVQTASKAFAALNAALLTNPYAVAAAAIAALVAGIAALTLSQEKAVSSAELLAESQENLAESCQGVFDQYGAWSDAVQKASGSLDALTSTMGVTQEKQEELAAEMDSVQAQITQIMKTASDERRGYTQSEIETLQDLFAQMRALAEQELAIQQSYQEAVVTQASALLETQNLTAEQYTTYASEIAAQAASTRDAVIASANDKYTQAIAYAQQERDAVLNSEAGKNEEQRALAEQAYQDALEAAALDYQTAIDSATAKANDTSAILAQGYAQNADLALAWTEKQAEISAQETANAEAYKQELLNIQAEYVQSVESGQANEYQARVTAQAKLQAVNEQYAAKEAETNNRRAESMDASTQRQIATLLEMVAESGAAYSDLDSTTQQMVGEFLENLDRLSPETKASLNETLDGMGMTIDDHGKLLYNGGEKSGQEVIDGWESKVPDLLDAADEAISEMSDKTGNAKLDGPEMGSISGSYSQAAAARSVIQSYLNNNPVYASVRTRTNASGGYWAKGGVTKYARGGFSPEIHKHAAGVFTKRTRLWDPVTGINEYGEAGHEALLPLKQSVYDEIAKGIVRQLSPAKLSGLVAALKSAVQSRVEAVTVQVVEKRELNAAEKALSPAPDTDGLRAELAALRGKLDRTVDALRNAAPGLEDIANVMAQAFSGLKVVMDSQPVGRLVTPAVNERLNDLYDLEERGRF